MTAFTEKLDRAAGAALCEGLTVAGGSLISAGAVSLAFGGAGIVPIAFGSAALMASAAGCVWESDDPGPPPSGPPQQLCYKGGSNFQINQLQDGVFVGGSTPELSEITQILFKETEPCQTGGSRDIYDIYWKNASGTTGVTALFWGGPCGGAIYTWEQVWQGDDTCTEPGPLPSIPIPPYEYTDPVDGCSLTVNWEGWATDGLGALNPVFKIEPAAELRQGGGRIGGCNFSPVIYTGNPGGPIDPPIIRPWNPIWDLPGPDVPLWAPFLREVLAGIASNAILEGITALLEIPIEPVTYTLSSVCEVGPDGVPETKTVQVSVPALNGIEAVKARVDALIPLLQGQKDFKQPVCPPVKLEGDFRTIGFISEENSPNGKSRLLKRLRYRSLSGIGQNTLVDYWKDFEFDAGPVTVKHRGASWGTITVWAATTEEGKRVIRHAASEALIDVDSVGRWEIGGSSSPRLGMPGRMKINTSGGYYWITNRDGPTERPLVGKT